MSNVKPIPDGFRTVTPHIVLKGAGEAIEFYKKAFGAEEICRMPGPDGNSVMHAEIKVGDSIVMLGDEFPGYEEGAKSPETKGGTTFVLHLYVKDCDAAFKKATEAGAKTIMPPTDMFWGDRYSTVADPYGHLWSIATHTQDLTPEQIAEGAAKMFGECGGG